MICIYSVLVEVTNACNLHRVNKGLPQAILRKTKQLIRICDAFHTSKMIINTRISFGYVFVCT
jgi:hypothetical protein